MEDHQQIAEALTTVLRHADARRHLHDDEHRDPLPIHGAARWFDRRPIADTEGKAYQQWVRRQWFQIPIETTNNEEGA